MSAEPDWPPPGEALLPLLGLSPAAEVAADPGGLLRPGRAVAEGRVLVDRTTWLIADLRGGVALRASERVLQVAVARAGARFAPFARLHWADLPHDLESVAAVVAPLCRSAERLHALGAPAAATLRSGRPEGRSR